MFLRKSLLNTVPHDDVTSLLLVVTMSPIYATKIRPWSGAIWVNWHMSCLKHLPRKNMPNIKLRMLHVKIQLQDRSWKWRPLSPRPLSPSCFLESKTWTRPLNSDKIERVTFLKLVIQLCLTLLFLSFEIIQFCILILRYKDFTALLSLRLAWSISHPLQLKDWLDSFYLGTVVLYQLFKLYHCNSISDHGKTGSGPEISSFAKMKGSKKSRTLRTLPGKCPVWRNANWINFVRCFPNQIFNNFRASFRAVSEPSFWTVLFMSVHFTF